MSAAIAENPAIVVITTFGSIADARSLVRHLVTAGVVACGTIVERVNSIYKWEGEVKEEPEVLVLLKTSRDRWADLENAVQELHPYEVPELLAIPVERGLPAYLEWLAGLTGRETV